MASGRFGAASGGVAVAGDDALAAVIYKPLATGKASKAVAAQYAAHLIETGNYGKDVALFEKLPPYLKNALNWLTGKVGAA